MKHPPDSRTPSRHLLLHNDPEKHEEKPRANPWEQTSTGHDAIIQNIR